jgi:hypothetical protein
VKPLCSIAKLISHIGTRMIVRQENVECREVVVNEQEQNWSADADASIEAKDEGGEEV